MIFIDNLKEFKGKLWCHCWSSSSESELHIFAKQIGIKRCWFQNRRGRNFPHYDLNSKQRELAIHNGAKEISLKEYLKLMK